MQKSKNMKSNKQRCLIKSTKRHKKKVYNWFRMLKSKTLEGCQLRGKSHCRSSRFPSRRWSIPSYHQRAVCLARTRSTMKLSRMRWSQEAWTRAPSLHPVIIMQLRSFSISIRSIIGNRICSPAQWIKISLLKLHIMNSRQNCHQVKKKKLHILHLKSRLSQIAIMVAKVEKISLCNRSRAPNYHQKRK